MNDYIKMSVADIAKYVNNDLMNDIGTTCHNARLTISKVETTLAAVLALSISDSAESREEIRIQVEAYAAFILSVAEIQYAGRMEVN